MSPALQRVVEDEEHVLAEFEKHSFFDGRQFAKRIRASLAKKERFACFSGVRRIVSEQWRAIAILLHVSTSLFIVEDRILDVPLHTIA
jgi:hypothetical protein